MGIEFFMGWALNIFINSFRASVKTNFNLWDNLKLHPNNITMVDNIIASTFNDIPLHIRSSLNVKRFKKHSKRFYSTFNWLMLKNTFIKKWDLSKQRVCVYIYFRRDFLWQKNRLQAWTDDSNVYTHVCTYWFSYTTIV